MLIINKYNTSTPAPVLATNDADVNTGITGATWGGCNPSALGVTGNAVAGVGLTNIATVNTYVEQVISKIIQVKFSGALTAGQDNFVRIAFKQLGITINKAVIGSLVVGVFDENAVENNNTPTPSWLNASFTSLYTSVIKDALMIKIPAANLALFQDKVVNILLIYT